MRQIPITTIRIIPPSIKQTYDLLLLIPWEGIMKRYEAKKDKWNRKIPASHTSRRKEFERLVRELHDLYERAKITQG